MIDAWFYYVDDEGWCYCLIESDDQQEFGPFDTWAECLEDWRDRH